MTDSATCLDARSSQSVLVDILGRTFMESRSIEFLYGVQIEIKYESSVSLLTSITVR